MSSPALILRASSWMDLECHQVLAATTDTEFCQVRVHRDGTFSVLPRCFPIRAVTSVSVGPYPSDMTALDAPDTRGAEPAVHRLQRRRCPR